MCYLWNSEGGKSDWFNHQQCTANFLVQRIRKELSPPYMMIVKFFNYVSSTHPKKTRVAKFSNVFNIVFYKCLSYPGQVNSLKLAIKHLYSSTLKWNKMNVTELFCKDVLKVYIKNAYLRLSYKERNKISYWTPTI